MADISPTNVWPELDGRRTAGVARVVYWQRFSTDDSYRVTASSSAATHYTVALSSVLGPQPYPGASTDTPTVMVLKGSRDTLLQITQPSADTAFWYHADVWVGDDGSGSPVFVGSSSQEAFYFTTSSSSTGVFELSTAQGSTNVYLGTAMPYDLRGVRVWERTT